MTRSLITRTIVSLGLLLGLAALPQTGNAQAVTCEEDCLEQTETCENVCQEHAGRAVDICISHCKELEKECMDQCEE